jgi:hypothetical protein
MERENGGRGLVCCLGKAEKLSYDRLLRCNRETVDDFLKLSRPTMEAVTLHQRLHLMGSMDELGLKLTYSSGNQKLLGIKGSKGVHTDTLRKGGEAVTVIGCMRANGSNLNLHCFYVRETTQGFEFK